MSAGHTHAKKRRLEMLESELENLESSAEVITKFRDKVGRKRTKKMPHTARQFKRIHALRDIHIPKAQSRIK
jgi:hypothetical protein